MSNQQISQYQKFRLQRINKKNDDDSYSYHFSATKSFSNTQTDRDCNLSTYRIPQRSTQKVLTCIQDNNQSYHYNQQKQQKYKNLFEKHQKLQRQYEVKVQQARKYKELYEKKIEKDKIVKQKLKKWVAQARAHLPQHLFNFHND